jgi:hypothetical protein
LGERKDDTSGEIPQPNEKNIKQTMHLGQLETLAGTFVVAHRPKA